MPKPIPPLNVVISSSQYAMALPRKRIRQLASFIAREEKTRISYLDIAVVTKDQIASINREYLGHAGYTDVISFDLSDDCDAGIVGQLIVCAPVAISQGKLHNNTPTKELLLYITHGLLHLTCYDDTNPEAAAKMKIRQEQLLDEFYTKR